MQFRTEINLTPSPHPITHADHLLLVGSCFTQNIGQLLKDSKFSAGVNPTGVLYNPLSILQTLQLLIDKAFLTENDLYHNGHHYLSFAHHGSFADPNAQDCLKKINQHLLEGSNLLSSARHIVLTFGTSFVYRRKDTQQVVANCHKLPDSFFTRQPLTVAEIVSALEPAFRFLFEQNERLRLILTVSPIRHWKDGAVNNQLSKATLILAIHELKNMFQDRIDYFPAYELMMDDLRDYRFYADDLLHPTTMAIQYIWQKFKSVYFTKQTNDLTNAIDKIRQAYQHKPLQPQSETYKFFAKQQITVIHELLKQYPHLRFEEELAYFGQAV